MSDSPCGDLRRRVEAAQREYEEARENARLAVITEPLKPENEPSDLPGGKGTNPQRVEREARRRLEAAEKALEDCSDSAPR